jgi:hypothetical protein
MQMMQTGGGALAMSTATAAARPEPRAARKFHAVFRTRGSLFLPHMERMVISVSLLAIAALLYLGSGWLPEWDWVPCLLAFELVCNAVPILYASRRGCLDICEALPVFLFGFWIHFWLRPFYDLLAGTLSVADIANTLRLSALCLPLFVFVYWMPPAGFVRAVLPVRGGGAAIFRVAAVAVVGIFGWAMVIREQGGINNLLFRERQMFAMISQTSTIYYEPLRPFLTVAVLSLSAPLIAGNVRSRFIRMATYLALAAYGFILFRVGGSRLPLANLFFAVLIQYHYLVRRISRRALAALAVFLFVACGVLGTYRSYFQFQSNRVKQEVQVFFTSPDRFLETTVGSADYAMFDTTAAVMRLYPDVLNYTHGASYLKLLFTPVPREVWPEKPENLSREAVRILGTGEDYVHGVSLGVSFIGEGYMNFGAVGALAGAAAIALFIRAIYSWFVHQPLSMAAVCIYSAGLFSLIFNVMRGALQTNVVEYAIVTGVAALIWASPR